MTTGNTKPVLQRVGKLPNYPEQGATNQPPITFDQVRQQVEWQYNAGRDIIINVQSRDELATKLAEMQQQIWQGFAHEVISQEVADHMQQQLDVIIAQLQSAQPQAEAILSDLETSRAYLQEASVKLAQQISRHRGKDGIFHFLAGAATLVAISFDLGLTATVVAGLFGLAVRSESKKDREG